MIRLRFPVFFNIFFPNDFVRIMGTSWIISVVDRHQMDASHVTTWPPIRCTSVIVRMILCWFSCRMIPVKWALGYDAISSFVTLKRRELRRAPRRKMAADFVCNTRHERVQVDGDNRNVLLFVGRLYMAKCNLWVARRKNVPRVGLIATAATPAGRSFLCVLCV